MPSMPRTCPSMRRSRLTSWSLDALYPRVVLSAMMASLRLRLGGLRSGATDVPRERGGMNVAFVLELKEEAVAPFGGELGHKGNGTTARPARRVYVEIREVTIAQRHEVPPRPQVALDGYRLTITHHREAKLDLAPGRGGAARNLDLIPVGRLRSVRLGRQLQPIHLTVDGQVRG